VRTYARITSGPLDYGTWIEAVQAGRSFITNSPLLTVEVDGQGPGHTFDTLTHGRPVHLRVEARGLVPFDHVEVLFNGEIVASRDASGDRQSAVLDTGFTPTAPGWLAARCRGSRRLPDGQLVFAHTSPLWFHPDGIPPRPTAAATARFTALLDRALDWTANTARCENPKAREHLLAVLGDARRLLSR
jgi:hypothetical protein